MKKKRAVAGGLLLVLGIAQSVSAGTTTVTYHVDPSYMVLVPANTTIPFNEESVNYGKIRVEEAQIEETVLGITIDRESWKKAPSGSYADTVTFQISYVDATD